MADRGPKVDVSLTAGGATSHTVQIYVAAP
jgi:hypothetical protein